MSTIASGIKTPAADTSAPSWLREASGSVADLGVLIPIAVALIVINGLSTTAVLLPAGLAYLLVARIYRVPVSVQPLKAFGALAIATGVGSDVIAAGALLMGAVFLALGSTGLLDWSARLFPISIIRGIQLAVGLTLARIAWDLVSNPPTTFNHQLAPGWVAVATVAIAVALFLRRWLVLVVVVVSLALATAFGAVSGELSLGPSAIEFPHLDVATFATAAVLLVLPQIPLTFANSCLASADAARTYFGEAAYRVTPARLARSLGAINLFAGGISGMPICHGAGGMSAHYSFGARTGRAPAMIGFALLILAVAAGASLTLILTAFPLPVLAALLVVAGIVHVALLKDLTGTWAWSMALAVGVVGFVTNLAWAVAGGLAVYAAFKAASWVVRRRRGLDAQN